MTPEHSIPSVSIFGGEYNAKARTLRQIAESFVAPVRAFERLIQPDNTILIGPRGSGKTTLLTMLQGPALELSPAPEAQEARLRIDYTGVIVPCDQSWAGQLRALTLEGPTSRRFARALFVLHALRALVQAAATRLEPSHNDSGHRRVQLTAIAEASLAQKAAASWNIGATVAGLRDLEEAISDEILQLGILRSSEELLEPRTRNQRLAKQPLLHLELVPAALAFITRFNNACDEKEGRWAFLFDELELAPSELSDMVLQLFRGVDRRLLFKVSYAPYEGEMGLPHGPREGQDYSVIRLSYANKREAFSFTRALLERRIARLPSNLSPVELLGETRQIEDDDGLPEPSAATYAPSAPAGRLLASLAERDDTFAEWLDSNGIRLETLADASEPLRARVRKVMPLVALRLEARRAPQEREEDEAPPPSDSTELRSRRNITLYSGEAAFLAMMEANPRWLEHVCDRLLDDANGPIPASRQSRIFAEAAQEFTSYLHILPVRGTHLSANDAPQRLLDRIGNYFRDNYIRGKFSSDAPGSILVDRKLSPTVQESLQALINRGALIEVPDRALPSVGPLQGRRYRLAYLLAPLYRLPLRLDKAIALSTVLVRSRGDDQLVLSDMDI